MSNVPENDNAGALRSGHGELVDPVTPEGRLLAWRYFFQAVAEERPGVLADLLRPDTLALQLDTVEGERGTWRAVEEWCERWRFPIQYASEAGHNTLDAAVIQRLRGEPLPSTFSFSDDDYGHTIIEHDDFSLKFPERAKALGIVRDSWSPAMVYFALRVPPFLSWDPTQERMTDADDRMVADFRVRLRAELARIRSSFLAEGFLEPEELRNLDIFRWLARRHLEPKETPATIAERCDVNIDTVKKGLARAKDALDWKVKEPSGRPRKEST